MYILPDLPSAKICLYRANSQEDSALNHLTQYIIEEFKYGLDHIAIMRKTLQNAIRQDPTELGLSLPNSTLNHGFNRIDEVYK